MNKERLLILADFLEKEVHAKMPNRFDFSNWVGCDWQGAQDLSCGTTACAIGWAPQVPEFKDLGLYYNKNKQICTERTDGSRETANWLFDLTWPETSYLFFPDAVRCFPQDSGLRGTATALDVAEHIRDFVRVGGIPPLEGQPY